MFAGFPGVAKSSKQIQASSQLFYDVFRKYDPNNQLLAQAGEEVLQQELDVERLAGCLRTLQARELRHCVLARPTPFAFPLMVERFRESSSSEKLGERIARMVAELEAAAGGEYFRAVAAPQFEPTNSAPSARSKERRRRKGKDGRPDPARGRRRVLP